MPFPSYNSDDALSVKANHVDTPPRGGDSVRVVKILLKEEALSLRPAQLHHSLPILPVSPREAFS